MWFIYVNDSVLKTSRLCKQFICGLSADNWHQARSLKEYFNEVYFNSILMPILEYAQFWKARLCQEGELLQGTDTAYFYCTITKKRGANPRKIERTANKARVAKNTWVKITCTLSILTLQILLLYSRKINEPFLFNVRNNLVVILFSVRNKVNF